MRIEAMMYTTMLTTRKMPMATPIMARETGHPRPNGIWRRELMMPD